MIAGVRGAGVADLMAILAERQAGIGLAWTALVGEEVVMAFNASDSPDAALDLVQDLGDGGMSDMPSSQRFSGLARADAFPTRASSRPSAPSIDTKRD